MTDGAQYCLEWRKGEMELRQLRESMASVEEEMSRVDCLMIWENGHLGVV